MASHWPNYCNVLYRGYVQCNTLHTCCGLLRAALAGSHARSFTSSISFHCCTVHVFVHYLSYRSPYSWRALTPSTLYCWLNAWLQIGTNHQQKKTGTIVKNVSLMVRSISRCRPTLHSHRLSSEYESWYPCVSFHYRRVCLQRGQELSFFFDKASISCQMKCSFWWVVSCVKYVKEEVVHINISNFVATARRTASNSILVHSVVVVFSVTCQYRRKRTT